MAFMVWLSVRIQLMNQNASPAIGEDVLAAVPFRATRESNERQPHRPINPPTHSGPPLLSHKVQSMNAAVVRRVLVVAGVAMALTAAAQTNSPDYTRWFIVPKPHLRTEHADPPARSLGLEQSETSLSSLPASVEGRQQDFHLYYFGPRDFDFIRPVQVERDPVTRAFYSIFQPEVFQVGRKTTLSCSILTAIKRRNPLCLLNPIFFEMTW